MRWNCERYFERKAEAMAEARLRGRVNEKQKLRQKRVVHALEWETRVLERKFCRQRHSSMNLSAAS